jgi:hypothetical protein
MNRWPWLLLIGFVVVACGSNDELRIRELEEQVAQLESENARLRRQIPPEDPLAPDSEATTAGQTWDVQPPREEIPEEPPPLGLVNVSSDAVEDAAADDPPEPAAEADTEPASSGPLLTVHRSVAARGVSARAPTGVAESFPASVGKVYCYTEVSPASPDINTTSLIHRWYRGDRSEGETRLKVAGDNWRTYSNRTVSDAKTGPWRVELVDTAGNVLSVVRFTVE